MTTAPPATDPAAPLDPPTSPAVQPPQTETVTPVNGDSYARANTPPAVQPNRETRRAEAKAARKKAPSFEQMRAKKPRTGDIQITLDDEDGRPEEFTVKIQALGSKAYDRLIAAHPPTNKQRDRQEIYNIDTFAPALISACLIDPKLTVEEVTELYDSDEWAPGEIGNLFFSCQRLCNMGIDVSFNGAG